MAERLNGAAEYESTKRYKEIRTVIHGLVSSVAKSIGEDMKYGMFESSERLDLFLKLMGQQLTEVRKWEEQIEGGAPVNAMYEDVKKSLDFYFEHLYKILNAATILNYKEMILAKLEQFFPLSEMSQFACQLNKCPKEATPEAASVSHQQVFQLPPAKRLAMENIPSDSSEETKVNIGQLQKVIIKLPELGLFQFHGDSLGWIEFWDVFEMAVHNNPELTNAHKFIYLKAYLTGDQFNFIRNMRTSDANYERAVSILKLRYGNIDKIIALRKTALLKMQPANEMSGKLKSFFQIMESHICALESLGVDTDDSTIVAPLLDKLPLDVKQRIFKKEHLVDGDLMTMDALRNALYLELQSV